MKSSDDPLPPWILDDRGWCGLLVPWLSCTDILKVFSLTSKSSTSLLAFYGFVCNCYKILVGAGNGIWTPLLKIRGLYLKPNFFPWFPPRPNIQKSAHLGARLWRHAWMHHLRNECHIWCHEVHRIDILESLTGLLRYLQRWKLQDSWLCCFLRRDQKGAFRYARWDLDVGGPELLHP